MISIEHADPERDSKPISELIGVCISERRTILNPYTPEEEREYLSNLLNREAVFVAYVKGDFAGFAGIAPRWSYSEKLHHCGEAGTWVMPEYRGMGVGKALWVEGIYPWCREKGFTHLGAMVMAHNTGSIAFYEKLGFHVSGNHRRVIDWDGEKLDAVEIENILD